jgi:transcriptional regulator with XRE-family HTH domain
MQDESLAKRLSAFMSERHLSQEKVAKACKISQPTVSRALKGGIKRQGRAQAKLFIYIQEELSKDVFPGKGQDKIMAAFDSIWDRTEEHATAIAKIIKASGGLVPAKKFPEKDTNAQ